MFPFPPNNHTQDYFGAPIPHNNPIITDNLILDDLINEGFLGSDIGVIPTTSSQRHEQKIRKDEVINVRKFLHRENERQRRQELANLCGSLRTLLPLQYVKGKRSMSDHLQGAVNYIKDMQNNILKLKSRRDKLKKLPNSQICVAVNPCPNGVEILINTISEEEQGFSLSRILTELTERGFNVVSCFSTRADERSLHRIQLEASNPTSQDLSALQERLTYMINRLH